MVLTTIGSAILAIIETSDNDSVDTAHSIAGFITLGVVVFTALLGLARHLNPYLFNQEWNTLKLQKIKAAHQYAAYVLIIGSQVTVSLGIAQYLTFNHEPKISYSIIGCTNIFFFAVLIASELVYRAS